MLIRLIPAALSSVLALATLAVTSPATAADPPPALFVSEVTPDNGTHTFIDEGGTERTGAQDNFEFFEVTNTTDADLDLSGYTLRYNTVTLVLAPDAATVVPANGSLALWLRYSSGSGDGYSSGSPNAELYDDADFNAHHGRAADAPVGHVTGQAGLANGGNRSLGIFRGEETVSVTTYLPEHVGPGLSGHYAVPAAGTTDAVLFAEKATPTPGAVADGQLVDATQPEPDPEPEPGDPGVPEQGPAPSVDPDLTAPILQVTEVAPDTDNIDGADAYEFIELYNGSAAPIAFDDFAINYLYIDANATTTNAALWPAEQDGIVIEPGRTLVLWIKNGTNDALTAADFNEAFGSRLTLGEDLVEIHSGGMANGGLRGIQVKTNTGHDISTSYYFNNDQTTATTAIQYAWNPPASPAHQWVPPVRDGTVQTLLGIDTPTPGYAAPGQVPAGLVATPAEDDAPVITDLTGGSELPETDDIVLGFDVSDDHQVRTVELTLDTGIGDPETRQLTFGAPGRYTYEIPAADLYGKRRLDYTVTVRDGKNTTSLGPVRIDLAEGEMAPVRISGKDGQFVRGTTRVTATSEGTTPSLELAGSALGTIASLEREALFVFEATNTDAFFRNGVKIGDEVLHIFDEGFYERIETVSAGVPVERTTKGDEITLGIHAGTKARPSADPNENNDDFSAMSPRLALPDGRVLRPIRCESAGEGQEPTVKPCPDPDTRIGFSDAAQVYFLATFEIPDDAFDSVAHVWDTTAVSDGAHTFTAKADGLEATRTLVVDNTAPVVSTDLEEKKYRGEFTIDASATDAGSGVATVRARLDGQAIELPLATSSVSLAAGEHKVEFTATDELGNETTRTITFTTPEEQPSTTLNSPAHDAEVRAGSVVLSATPTDPEGDRLDVEFRKGHRHAADAEAVQAYSGTTHDASSLVRDDKEPLSHEELAKLVGTDGLSSEVTSGTEFPYQLFTVDVPDDAGEDASVRVHWAGSANAGAKVLMHVLNTEQDAEQNTWTQVDKHLTTGTGATDFELDAVIPVAGHRADGKVTVLVQHSEGFTTPDQSARGDAVTAYSEKGVTPRADYDFTIGWESDTQYYNETEAYYKHQVAINKFFLDQRDNLNLQYVVHTGDIVDDWDQPYQWANANPVYKTFDDAGLPYGVLAGNHDVGHHAVDYGPYGEHFGEDRYAQNPWYGGSYKNNRGSYNLISANGVDLLFLSMGWGAGDAEIAWMNEVIRKYPERKVLISLHEFMLTTGGLGPIPQQVMDEVVATNPNVFAVTSGHYHDAFTRLDEFDDDKDGVADRTVTSMLFDYQGLPEGGLGYLRLLHFDNQGERIIVRTYSPSLDDFDSDDPSLEQQHQEFEIPYVAAGLGSVEKTLATDEFRADVLTSEVIADFEDVASGTRLETTWKGVADGETGWYVVAADPYGAVDSSAVHNFTASTATLTETPAPVVTGSPKAGETLAAVPGTWGPADPEVRFSYAWAADGKPIADETHATLVVKAAHVGSRITVQVTGTQDGYHPVTQESAPTEVVTGGVVVPATPQITGVAKAGETLSVSAGDWGPPDPAVQLTHQWLADGKEIPGATGTTLELEDGQVGARITVRVTGTQAGYDPASATSEPTAAVVARDDVLEPLAPRITGSSRVGTRLHAWSGNWGRGVTYAYQWNVDGEALAGATGKHFVPSASLAGARITVTVTGQRSGSTASATSEPTKIVAKGKLASSSPTLGGSARAGARLKAWRGAWTYRTTHSFAWYADGKRIAGARWSFLVLADRHVGKRITVRVTGAKKGYVTASRTSGRTMKVRGR